MKPSALFRVTPKIAHHASWIGLKNLKKSVIEVKGFMAPGRSRPWRRGDSGRCAPHPSSRPSASRSARSPHSCSASTRGSSGRQAAGSWKWTADNRGSRSGTAWSWLYLGEPERSQRSLRPEVGERDLERRRAGDQDHVISYSHLAQRRTRSEDSFADDLAEPSPGPVACDRALDPPAHRHADPTLGQLGGNGEPDQGAPAVEPPTADGGLEVRPPANPQTTLHDRVRSDARGGA